MHDKQRLKSFRSKDVVVAQSVSWAGGTGRQSGLLLLRLQSYQHGLINNNNIDALEEAQGGGGFISERQEEMFDSTRSRVKPFKE